jgi:hypothetical protein
MLGLGSKDAGSGREDVRSGRENGKMLSFPRK